MSSGLRPKASAPLLLDLPGSSPPTWVDEWVGPSDVSADRGEILHFEARRGVTFSRLSVTIEDVERMDTRALQQCVSDAYRMVFEHLAAQRLHLLRIWAAIPRIHAGHADLDRYMVFNAGRFAAFSAWLGGREEFSRSVTTASAVGSSEATMQIHCLASCEPGIPVDNPRQVPAYRYSRQFGPLPPCFSRATLLPSSAEESAVVMVGGTASIVGEASRHRGDLAGQIDETLRNLAAVVASAGARAAGAPQDGHSESQWLATYRELRLYHREKSGRDEIVDKAMEAFTGASRVEVRQAELCRPELLVEIEGVAELPPAAASGRWP
jgi:chorismate lyase / 3-hydroxybenzoate synthase